MAIDPISLTAAYHAAINALDFKAIENCFAPDIVYNSAGIGSIDGRDAVMSAFLSYFERFPDQVASDESIEQTGMLQARSIWTIVATNNQTGDIVQRSGEEVVTFDLFGKIVKVEVVDEIR